MDCEEIRELLALYAGGELDPGERVAAEAHLSCCADCGRELDLYREARARLADLREDEPPPGVWQALRRGTGAELPVRRSPGLALRLAAVLLLGVTIGLAAHAARRGAPAPPATPAAVATVDPGQGGVVPAAPAAGAMPLRLPVETKPRSLAPEAAPDVRHYLPRVESFPPPGEREF